MKKLIFTFVVLIVSKSAFPSGWIGPNEISTMEISSSAVVLTSSGGFNLNGTSGCTHNFIAVVNSDQKLVDRFISTSLALKAMGKKAKFYNQGCLDGYLVFTRIKVEN